MDISDLKNDETHLCCVVIKIQLLTLSQILMSLREPCVLMRVATRLELEEENFLFKTSKPATDTGILNMLC